MGDVATQKLYLGNREMNMSRSCQDCILILGSRSPSPDKHQSAAGSRSPSLAKSKSRSPSPHDEDARSNTGSDRSARGSDDEDKVSTKSLGYDEKSGM